MIEWLKLTTCETDVDAGYAAISETVEAGVDNLEPLEAALETIESEKGVPSYRINVTEHWIDSDGKEHSDFYGTAEEYLL